MVSPVTLGAMYYGALVPAGLIMRAVGRDPLRLKREPQAATYWVERQPPGPEPQSMPRQY